ncbi:hypothetical protein LUZ60_010959 [Juncus effusus]|nr:hypothetical protein LUZ60_010959 [Juncus effusus]
MSSKREEERNEKIIRGLMKLPPNRRCINCNSVGPQYVCTNFWTFVCLSCSGIHREFTHRVKSVSMSKFTSQEVNSLQQGGNQRFREVYLKNWDMTRMRLPDSSNPERIRDFIRSVYVNKKYFGERASERPPTDVESPMAGDEVRRPSSYHSFSQSPPYDYQYEERRYGKALVTPAPRRLGSARAGSDDRFANERDRDSTASRLSDFSLSSAGDVFRFHAPQRTSSSGSFGSFDSSSLPDTTVQEQQQQPAPQQLTRGPHQPVLTSSSSLPPLAKPTSPPAFNQQIDLFAGFNEQNLVNKPGPAFNAPNQVQVNKPGSPFNTQNQVQVNKPGPPFNAPSQVQVNKPGPAFNAQNQVQVNKPGPAFNTPNQVQVNKPGASINAPSQVQVNKPDAASIDLFAGFNTQPSNEGWANFDSPQKNTQVQSSPVVVSTGEDLQRPVITTAAQAAPVKITAVSAVQTVQTHTVPFTSQETSQVWDAYAFGESSGNINQLSVPNHTEPVSVPNAQLSPLNEVQIPVQSTITPVLVPQTVSHAMVPTNQEKSETWNAFGESNTLVAPVPVGVETAKATGTTATQIPVQSAMPTERAPLPDTLFTNQGFSQSWSNAAVNHVYGSTPLSSNNNNVYGNVNVNAAFTNNKPSVAYDQYLKMESSNMDGVYPNMNINNPPNIAGTIPASFQPLQGMPYQTTKSTNPFDFPDESDIQPNNNMYMDMSSLQAALPAQQAPFDFYSQFYTQNSSSTYSPSIPQGGMQYLSGQAPNPQLPNLPPQSTYPSLGGNPFA